METEDRQQEVERTKLINQGLPEDLFERPLEEQIGIVNQRIVDETGKFLKSVKKISPRAVWATGPGVGELLNEFQVLSQIRSVSALDEEPARKAARVRGAMLKREGLPPDLWDRPKEEQGRIVDEKIVDTTEKFLSFTLQLPEGSLGKEGDETEDSLRGLSLLRGEIKRKTAAK
jgi:hypothetical protein